ncbi:tripartite tricarboxylate transporter substrate-binding protein [uncultured Ilyobacter sp.]|uniref:Bug family tripartite tricarboxylate transporter substrate binding protein n=1 Tax=uncultured Ilyobacter sp. TaxID=544433 RepID=UPI0029C7E3C9|nr:tripartite tricarboxylate transporter substrate-binding protein [uncultured Ilyobacter sp.]
MKKRNLFLTLALILGLAFTGCGSKKDTGKAEQSFPTAKTLEIIAPANPGGGWDATARALKKVIDDNNIAPEVNIIVTNKPGGKGSIAWNSLIQRKDSHIVAMDSAYIYLNQLLGVQGAQKLDDLRPVATLTNEWIGYFVKGDSDIKTITEVTERLKKDPGSVVVAVAPGKGNDDHLSIMNVAKTAGVDIAEFDKNIVATSTGELIPGVLGGFYEVIVTGAADGIEFMKSGDLRCIAITADERLGGEFASVPTVKESGIDVVFPHWRGIVAHPGMTDEEADYWETIIEKATATDDWKKIMENNSWLPYYKNSSETRKMWEKEFKVYKDLTDAVGLTK